MKKTLYILATLALSLFAVSCSDFLEETPKGQLTDNLAFTHAGDLESALGVLRYKVSRATFNTTQFEQSYMGDDLATHPMSNKAAMREWDRMEVSSGNERLYWCWQDKYLVIKAANFIINGAEKTPDVPQSEIDRAINTAKFWRAWAYFYLVRCFGALPLVTSLDVDYGIGLTSVAGVYDLIVADLKDAEGLPDTNKYGLVDGVTVNQDPNSGAAKALLSCVYLNMAGWPLNKGTEYYTLAAQKAKEVIDGANSGKYYYKLYADYRDIHSNKCNLNNTEAIISVYYDKTNGDGDSGLVCRGGIMDLPDCSNAWCDTRGELKFYAEFEGAYRKSVVYPKTVVKGTGIFDFWESAVREDNRFPYFGEKAWRNDGKEYDFTDLNAFDQEGVNGWDTQAHMLIRLSEVYCWYAEALGRSGQTNAEAVRYLNEIRNRAEGVGATPNIYPSSMSADALAEAAYNEHRWEIGGWWAGAVESCFNDMCRMKRVEAHFNYRKAATPVNVAPGVQLSEPYGPTENWADWRVFVPYPAEEIQRNINLDVDVSRKLEDAFINGTEVIKQSVTE